MTLKNFEDCDMSKLNDDISTGLTEVEKRLPSVHQSGIEREERTKDGVDGVSQPFLSCVP